jgi:hypothetical protein
MSPESKDTDSDLSKIIAGSGHDGWYLGLIGEPWQGPWPKVNGDLFVVSPDGGQAGLAWESDAPSIKMLLGPDESRWGVFQVRFPIPVMHMGDLVLNFHEILPLLKKHHALVVK